MLSPRVVAALTLIAALPTREAWAQRPLPQALADPLVTRALAAVDAGRDGSARWLAAIGGIVSPSGEERERAEAVAAEMRRIGLVDVAMDSSPNVVGRIRGRSGKALVFVSTLDDLATVAEHQRAAKANPRVEGDRVVGPGTNTSTTTASLVAAADALIQSGLAPEHDLVFAAVAREETGLVGMKTLYDQWKDRALAFVDGLGDGHSVTSAAITIHRGALRRNLVSIRVALPSHVGPEFIPSRLQPSARRVGAGFAGPAEAALAGTKRGRAPEPARGEGHVNAATLIPKGELSAEPQCDFPPEEAAERLRAMPEVGEGWQEVVPARAD